MSIGILQAQCDEIGSLDPKMTAPYFGSRK